MHCIRGGHVSDHCQGHVCQVAPGAGATTAGMTKRRKIEQENRMIGRVVHTVGAEMAPSTTVIG